MILKAQHKQLLKRLEYKSSALKSFTHGDNGVGNVSVHYENYLNDLQNFGYVVSVDDVWHITGFGLAALQEKRLWLVLPEFTTAQRPNSTMGLT